MKRPETPYRNIMEISLREQQLQLQKERALASLRAIEGELATHDRKVREFHTGFQKH